MNIKRETIDKFCSIYGTLSIQMAYSSKYVSYELIDWVRMGEDMKNLNYISICGFVGDRFVDVSFSTPKNKEITVDYLIKKVNDKMKVDNYYTNLTKVFEKLITNARFYATTYGIGMETLFYNSAKSKEDVETLEKFLTENKIEYRNEYSDARWVYRFIISKSKENIEKIKNIKTN